MTTTASNQITFLDIAKMNGADPVVGLIDETLSLHPEIQLVPARTIKGLSYKTIARVGLPTVAFREGNQGTAGSKGRYENRTVGTFLLTPRWSCDKQIADAHEDGAQALLSIEASGQLESSMVLMARQFYYGADSTLGVTPDALGYPGLMSLYDATGMTVDAAGTTTSTGSSVWAVKFGSQNIQWVFGNNGNMTPSDIMIQNLYDSNNFAYTGYVQEMAIRPGLQLGSLLGVGRAKNLTADSGKGLTDSVLADLFAKFKAGLVPDAIFMSRRSRTQLQKSRTVVLYGGGEARGKGNWATVAPLPTEYGGVPIYATDAILDTETIV